MTRALASPTSWRRPAAPRAEAEATLLAANPQGRFIEPEEVTAAALWLCGAGAASVTGQAIAIAGGETVTRARCGPTTPASQGRLRLWLRILGVTRLIGGASCASACAAASTPRCPRFDVMAALHRAPRRR